MKNLKTILLGIIFLCLFTNAFSQSADRVWLIDEVVIKSEQVANFEESLKEIMGLFKENNYPYEVQVYRSTGFKYYFSRELESMASYDDVGTATNACWSKIDKDIFENFANCFVSDKEFIMKEMGNYTYRPEPQRVPWSEFNYAIWDVHYVKFDKQKEYLDVMDQLNALIKKHNYDDPILQLQGMVGTENPMYAGVLFGKDAIDRKQQIRKMWDSFGEEGSELYQRWIPLFRDRDKIEFWFRRDLSYYKD